MNNSKQLLEDALCLLKEIELLGYEAYIVGGMVRDFLLKKEISDIDIATNCPIENLENHFITHDIGRSKDFGILAIVFNNSVFEVAQFREDGNYSDSRRPDSIKIASSLKEDVRRRDFTVNALAMNSALEIIDYVGGQKDLENRLIRAVGDPYKRFSEDVLRIMRAARFVARDEFQLDENTRIAAQKQAENIIKVSPERIRNEFMKAGKRSGPEFAKFILSLDDLKVLPIILPELTSLKHRFHNLKHHPEGREVFIHVIECLKCLPEGDPLSKMATLLHDIGKSTAFQIADGYMTFHRHEIDGAKLAEKICKRFKFNKYETDAIVFSAKNHMKFNLLLDMKPAKIARLVSSIHFGTLVNVAYADEFSRGETFMYYNTFKEKLNRANEIAEKWKSKLNSSRQKLVSGNLIMEVLNITPSKQVGEIKRRVEDRIINESINYTDIEKVKKVIEEVYNGLLE